MAILKATRRKVTSVQAKLGILIITATSLALVCFAGISFFINKATMEAALEKCVTITSERLSVNLINPLWNLDKEKAENVLGVEMLERQVKAILIWENDGKTLFLGKERNSAGEIVDYTGELSGNHVTRRVEVAKEEEKLGKVDVFLSTSLMREKLYASMVRIIIAVVVLNLLLAGLMFLAFRKVLTKPLRLAIDAINSSRDQLAVTSGQVEAASRSLADGANHQASSLHETSASLEEVSSMIEQNAENSKKADLLMQETNGVISRANEMMSGLTDSMEKISSSSNETSQIIKTIDEIAFQTNLLALNAAVEAARAGQAGVGFAVVAEEVRSLALRSAEAAKSTNDLIAGTDGLISQGAELVRNTGESFSEVTANATKVGAFLGEIATASKEQALGIDHINKAVAEMSGITQDNADNAGYLSEAARATNRQVHQVKEVIDDMAELIGQKTAVVEEARSEDSEGAVSEGSRRKLADPAHIPA